MSIAQGAAEWGRIVEELEKATVQSVTNPNPQFDAARWQYTVTELSENVAAFLSEEKQRFERDKYGAEKTRAVLPLYIPRVTMAESVHVMPAEPRAADAFKSALPERVEDLKSGGPDWIRLCSNAIRACQAKEEKAKQQQVLRGGTDAAATAASGAEAAISRRLHKLPNPGKIVDFIPIILVSGGPTATIQIKNVQAFLEHGVYQSAASEWTASETGETNLAQHRDHDKQLRLVQPDKMLSREPAVKFRLFRVVDDPGQVDNWDHVCAAFVNGSDWEFEGWYKNTKANRLDARSVFDVRLKGFLPYFEDEKEPHAIKMWRVVPLQLSRKSSKAHIALRCARLFWENLFEFLETHESFRDYTLASRGMTANR